MKITNQILIVVIFIALVFAIKSDYKSVPSRVLSYLKGEVDRSSGLYKEKVSDVMDSIGGNSDIKTNVEAPGALVVKEEYLTYDTKNINLQSKNIIEITNKYRKENGDLTALKENSKLDFSAEKKLQDMFMKQYFEHASPEGVGVGDLGTQVSYDYIIIGENLALGNFKDDKALVDAWMNSPGHRANILNKRYTEIGVAVGHGMYNGKSVWMSVQHFALPKSACPSIDEVLRGVIDLDQKNIKTMEADLSERRLKIDSGVVSEGMTTNSQIDKYNILVSDYNKLIASIKEKINKYNEQVRSFNECIAEVSS